MPEELGRTSAVLDRLHQAAKYILSLTASENFYSFSGEMGAGKTTLIQAIGKEMGVKQDISSPTFSLVNEYQAENQSPNTVYHFDFYRIETLEEVYDIGYEEYFYSGNTCFIEWPEKIQSLLPDNYVEIRLSRVSSDDKSRELTIFKH